MNRRGFLGLLGGAAAVTLIGELPTSKTFFLPPAGGWNLRNSLADFAAYCAQYDHLDYAADGQRISRAMAALRQTKWFVQAEVLNGMAKLPTDIADPLRFKTTERYSALWFGDLIVTRGL